LAAFGAGEDVHQSVADRLNISRPVAKELNFGAIYGIGVEAFAKNAGIDTVESGAVLTAFRREHGQFIRWSKALKDEVTFSPDGIIHTRSGRPIKVARGQEYRSTNYCVQSTARDLLCWGLTELDKAGLAGPLRLPIHDEFLASVPEDDAEEYLRALVETMSQNLDGVELSVEGTVVGKAWGDAYRPEVPDG
jgi:DNA polymerase-1